MESNLEVFRNHMNIEGVSNYPKGKINLIVANHSCLRDIFYIAAALPEKTVNIVSSRVLYKKKPERQALVNKCLEPMPIEANGGRLYSDICISQIAKILASGVSINIFPQGVYDDGKKIYRGRTGTARILMEALKYNIKVNVIPVALDWKTTLGNLDGLDVKDDFVNAIICSPEEYTESDRIDNASRDELHGIVDRAMLDIATTLGRDYDLSYSPNYIAKSDVIFSDGTSINAEDAKNSSIVSSYEHELGQYTKKLIKRF